MTSVKVPTVLYHYTNNVGLLGILNTSTLWASNIHYLNDSKEFQHAIESALQVLRNDCQNLEDEWRKKLIKRFTERLDQISQVSILVASLSEDGDSLSQWRGYCPAGGGYAVGFDHGVLSSVANANGFRLLPCSYSESEHRVMVKPLISKVLKANEENLDVLLNNFLSEFVQIAPMMKHSSFKEEREWRLVSGLFPTNRPDWQVRIGRTMLIPYAPLNTGKAKNSAICEVVVGPTPHQNLASSSVSSLLNKAQIKKWTVRHSQTSYRDW